jgi:hypothetical protein
MAYDRYFQLLKELREKEEQTQPTQPTQSPSIVEDTTDISTPVNEELTTVNEEPELTNISSEEDVENSTVLFQQESTNEEDSKASEAATEKPNNISLDNKNKSKKTKKV